MCIRDRAITTLQPPILLWVFPYIFIPTRGVGLRAGKRILDYGVFPVYRLSTEKQCLLAYKDIQINIQNLQLHVTFKNLVHSIQVTVSKFENWFLFFGTGLRFKMTVAHGTIRLLCIIYSG